MLKLVVNNTDKVPETDDERKIRLEKLKKDRRKLDNEKVKRINRLGSK